MSRPRSSRSTAPAVCLAEIGQSQKQFSMHRSWQLERNASLCPNGNAPSKHSNILTHASSVSTPLCKDPPVAKSRCPVWAPGMPMQRECPVSLMVHHGSKRNSCFSSELHRFLGIGLVENCGRLLGRGMHRLMHRLDAVGGSCCSFPPQCPPNPKVVPTGGFFSPLTPEFDLLYTSPYHFPWKVDLQTADISTAM